MSQWWDEVAAGFVDHYYAQFDAGLESRVQLAGFYQADSMLTFNGENLAGPEAIAEKLQSLGFKSVTHLRSGTMAQPAPNGGVIVLVSGQLQADDDHPLPYCQVFHLLPAGDTYYVYNDIFSLVTLG